MNCNVEPTSYQEAIEDLHYSVQWIATMDDEYTSLIKNDVWELVPQLHNHNIVTSKQVYKRKSDGRFKAQLVTHGFTQQYGIDYDETFVLVAKFASIQIILAIAVAEDLEVHQMDVKTAFLYGEIDTKIYIEQPEGYSDNN